MIRPIVSAVVVAVTLTALPACNNVEFPNLTAIEQLVLNDLENDKTDSLGTDVCSLLGGTSATDVKCADVEAIIQAAVTLLMDTGVLSPHAAANARVYLTAHAATVPACK